MRGAQRVLMAAHTRSHRAIISVPVSSSVIDLSQPSPSSPERSQLQLQSSQSMQKCVSFAPPWHESQQKRAKAFTHDDPCTWTQRAQAREAAVESSTHITTTPRASSSTTASPDKADSTPAHTLNSSFEQLTSPESTVVSAAAGYISAGAGQMSPEQKLVLDLILAGKNVFFTGAAGSGKSFVLRCLREVLQQRDMLRHTYFTGSTGIAAINVGGCTLHSFAGIGLGKESSKVLVEKVKSSRGAVRRWRSAKLLIIDEISMLDADTFDKLCIVGAAARNDDRPFGGVQLVICGDFFQLPPVNHTQFAFESKYWPQVMEFSIILTQIYRQKDKTFLKILNELREGIVSKRSKDLLEQQIEVSEAHSTTNKDSQDEHNEKHAMAAQLRFLGSSAHNTMMSPASVKSQAAQKIQPTRLFSRNKDVDDINENELTALDGKTWTFEADDSGLPEYRNQLKSCPAPTQVHLKVGAQVMLLKNLSVDTGLCNGTRGVVVGFAPRRDVPVAYVNGSPQTYTYDEYPIVLFKTGHYADAPLKQVIVKEEEWTIQQGVEVMASRLQIPLRLAWAISIHKSQGMTIPNLEVTFKGIFEFGQAYVALSRATSLDGLILRDFNPKLVKAHCKVKSFYKALYDRMDEQQKLLSACSSVTGPLSEDEINLLKSKPVQTADLFAGAKETGLRFPALDGSSSRSEWVPRMKRDGEDFIRSARQQCGRTNIFDDSDEEANAPRKRSKQTNERHSTITETATDVRPAAADSSSVPQLTEAQKARIEQNRCLALERLKRRRLEAQVQTAAAIDQLQHERGAPCFPPLPGRRVR